MFLQEIRHSLRMLARSPGFTIVAALSIALGIGVNSALFSFHDAILLRPLPVREPGSIMTISTANPDVPSSVGRLSYPNYRDLRDRSRSFDGMLADQLMLFSFARSRQAESCEFKVCDMIPRAKVTPDATSAFSKHQRANRHLSSLDG